MKCVKSYRYIYILGAGGSGSTMLERLLGGHPHLEPLGEIDKLSLQFARGDRFCGCKEYPTKCYVWKTVAEAIKERYDVELMTQPFEFRVSDVGWEEDWGWRATKHWLKHKNSRLWRYLAYRRTPLMRHVATLHRTHHRWVEHRLFVADIIRQYHNATGVIDNSKDYLGFRDLEAEIGDDLKTIFITRSVYSSVWSIMKRNPNMSIEHATQEWTKVNARSLQMLQGIPQDRWIHLKYEDLCHNLEESLKQLCDFIGYDFDLSMCDLSRSDHHTIGGNKIRLEAISKLQEDTSWKQNLSTANVQRITKIASGLSAQLGYKQADEVNE